MNAVVRHWDTMRVALAADKDRLRRFDKTDEAIFLPAALEIVERPVSPTARFTARMLLIVVLLSVLWLIFSRIDVVASAPGRLIPADNVKLVQPAQAGIVHAILIEDGQHVRMGQPLVELDPTVSSAETAQAQKALEVAELNAARARAVLSALDGHGLLFTPPAGTAPDIVSLQADLGRAELRAIQSSAMTQSADREAALAARQESSVQAAKLEETLPLLDTQLAAYEGLLEKGLVSRLKVIELRRQRLAAGKDRTMAIAATRQADAQLRSAAGNEEHTVAEARVQVLDNLAKATAEAKLRREEMTKAIEKSSLQTLRSPVDGTITQLAIHTVGGVVEAAKPIMAIVPTGGSLVAEVQILNKDVGFVRVGQPVALKLAAFPFTRYGTVDGRVYRISSDSVQDEKLGLIYTARIKLARAIIHRDGEIIRLGPGMEATADIKTGQRSIMSYLLSSIDEVRQNAGHER